MKLNASEARAISKEFIPATLIIEEISAFILKEAEKGKFFINLSKKEYPRLYSLHEFLILRQDVREGLMEDGYSITTLDSDTIQLAWF